MVPEWLPAHRLAVALAGLLALALVLAADRGGGRLRRLRARLLLGVPWGTLLTVAGVACVYLFVQRGIDDPHNPVVIPFRAWSYFYLEGMLLAAFSHASLDHVTGNLVTALVAGSLAEYAWGHYPRERGAAAFSGPTTNPYVRAFVVVPAAMVVCGVVTALFALGPVVGFSGVVFALWGFALVRYPLGTVVALSAASVVRLLYDALRHPVVEASASPSFSGPWWAGIAIQGHALGLFVGVIAGLWLSRRREAGPTALRLFVGTLLFAATRGLWAVYWYRGGETYVLYQAVGTGLVFLLAALVAVAGAGQARPIASRLAVADPGSVATAVRSATPRSAGLVLLVLGAALIAGPGLIPNLATAADEPPPGDRIEVDGYQVTYAEKVPDGMVSVVEVDAFGETTAVNTSGVIVYNPDRHVWTTAVSAERLAFGGTARVDVGGAGWRETVRVRRDGWRPVGGDAAYRVRLAHGDAERTVFVSEPVRAEPRVAGRNVTVRPRAGGFDVVVTRGNRTEVTPMPAPNGSVRLLGVRLVREDDRLFVERDDSRVRVATAEAYRERQRALP